MFLKICLFHLDSVYKALNVVLNTNIPLHICISLIYTLSVQLYIIINTVHKQAWEHNQFTLTMRRHNTLFINFVISTSIGEGERENTKYFLISETNCLIMMIVKTAFFIDKTARRP